MGSKQKNFNDKDDDDVSVIAVIGKENDRTSRQQQDEELDEKQEDERVFELSDERSKMALRKQLDLGSLSTELGNVAQNYYEGIEILQKLPPGTIVIKQEKRYKDDSDYVRDSTEISSGGSTSSNGVTKVKRIYRSTRKK
ncbi:hypothetical protein HZU73_01946 [Apis mellifera caucasica]|nr:hypothetical protein HZU73_01946 [Apis mellifera caucasica]KAG9431724.1 hypothetical protein HZU67_06369 [Apis mellifera carnica]